MLINGEWRAAQSGAHFSVTNPANGEVIDTMREHARLLCGWVGERIGIRDFRKHATWYTKGFPGSTKMRDKLIRIDSLAELDSILDEGDDARWSRNLPFRSLLKTKEED